MNFKNLLFVCLIGFTFGCGVKAPPAKYPDTMVDSYIQRYTGQGPTPEELERIRINREATEEAAKKQEEQETLLNSNP